MTHMPICLKIKHYATIQGLQHVTGMMHMLLSWHWRANTLYKCAHKGDPFMTTEQAWQEEACLEYLKQTTLQIS